MRSYTHLVFCTALLMHAMVAQSNSTTNDDRPSAEKKHKRVFTEEDLKKLRGGISIVGTTGDTKPTRLEPRPMTASSREQSEAGKHCKSTSWAAVVYAVTTEQDLPFDQIFWHHKLFGHRFCTDSVGSLQGIASSIRGEYVLNDGRHALITVSMHKSLPTPEAIANAYLAGKRLVVVLRGLPYVIEALKAAHEVSVSETGATAHTGRILIHKLDLYDPDTETHEYFDRNDNLAEIDGSFYVQVEIR